MRSNHCVYTSRYLQLFNELSGQIAHANKIVFSLKLLNNMRPYCHIYILCNSARNFSYDFRYNLVKLHISY